MARILNLILGPHRFATESPWSVLTAICGIFGAVILSLVATIIAAAVVIFLGPAGSAGCIATDISAIEGSGCARWLLALVGTSSVVMIVAFFALSHARQGSTPGNTLLMRDAQLRWWQYAAMSAGLIVVLLCVQVAISWISGVSDAELELGINYLKELVTGSGWLNWFLIISVVVLAGPITEEIIFRGFMFTTLIKTRLGFIGTAIITSGCWTMLHYQYTWHILIVLFGFGLALAYVVWRTGSLWPGIVAHAANNLVSSLILVLR
ncbi:MAG: CPBP family intramembrane metalloprotease [Rhizobiales bacterium]|nr:CPBP family intramembrane metalloprotease [Hyphomicrobiales bacterium]